MTLPRDILLALLAVAVVDAARAVACSGDDSMITIRSSTRSTDDGFVGGNSLDGCYERSKAFTSSSRVGRDVYARCDGSAVAIVTSSQVGNVARVNVGIARLSNDDGSTVDLDNPAVTCAGQPDLYSGASSPLGVDMLSCSEADNGSSAPGTWSVLVARGCSESTTGRVSTSTDENKKIHAADLSEARRTTSRIQEQDQQQQKVLRSVSTPVVLQGQQQQQQQQRLRSRSLVEPANNGSTGNNVGDCDLIGLDDVSVTSADFYFVTGVYTKSCTDEPPARVGDGKASWYMTDDNGQPVSEIFYAANNGTWSVGSYAVGVACRSTSSTTDPSTIPTAEWLCDSNRDGLFAADERGDWTGVTSTTALASTTETSKKTVFLVDELSWALSGVAVVLLLGVVACCIIRTRRRKKEIAIAAVTLEDAYPEDHVLPWTTRGPPVTRYSQRA